MEPPHWALLCVGVLAIVAMTLVILSVVHVRKTNGVSVSHQMVPNQPHDNDAKVEDDSDNDKTNTGLKCDTPRVLDSIKYFYLHVGRPTSRKITISKSTKGTRKALFGIDQVCNVHYTATLVNEIKTLTNTSQFITKSGQRQFIMKQKDHGVWVPVDMGPFFRPNAPIPK
jgi:hypothetical protein